MPEVRRTGGSRRAAVALACTLVCVTGALAAADEIIERVLAVVGGELILATDVAAAREFRLVETDPGSDPVRETLSRLIDRALVLAEVERYAPREPGADVIDRRMDEVRSRFSSPDAFQAALARTGLNERQLRERIRQELRISAYLDQRFTVAAASEDEIAGFYREHAERFTRLGQLMPLDDVRAAIVRELAVQSRQSRVDEWLAGLRRRAQIVDLSSK